MARARGDARVTARSDARTRAARKRAREKGAPEDDQYGCGAGGCDGGGGDYGGGTDGGSASYPPFGRPYPLSGNTWTQSADETDQFIGELVYTDNCEGDFGQGAVLTFRVDGRRLGAATLPDKRNGRTYRESFEVEDYPSGAATLFEPGKSKRRKLTVGISDSCLSGSVTVRSLRVNVLGFR